MSNRQLADLLRGVIATLDQQLAIIKWEGAIMAGIKPGPKELALKEMREARMARAAKAARVAKAKAVIDQAIAKPKLTRKPKRGGGKRGK